MIQLYKLTHNVDNVDYRNFFEFSPITYTRGDCFKIFITRCQSSIRQNSLIPRTVKIWNDLKFDTKNVDSVNSFKNALDRDLYSLRFEID